MGYKYFIFDMKDARAERLIPEGEKLSRYRVGGCMDESTSQLIGYAVFDINTFAKGRYRLINLWVEEDYRLEGVATEILNMMKKIFIKVGVTSIYIDYSDNPRLASQSFDVFLTKVGFEPVGTYGKRINYFVSKIKGSHFMELLNKMPERAFGVKLAGAEDADEIKNFISNYKAKDSLVKIRTFSPDLTFVKRSQGQIVGMVVGHKINNMVISLDDIYRSENCNEKDMNLLLGGAMRLLVSPLGDETLISMRLIHEKLYPLVVNAFAEPDSEMVSDNYIMRI